MSKEKDCKSGQVENIVKCQSLNENGNKCRKKLPTKKYKLFLDNELYDGWVEVYLCAKCYDKIRGN